MVLSATRAVVLDAGTEPYSAGGVQRAASTVAGPLARVPRRHGRGPLRLTGPPVGPVAVETTRRRWPTRHRRPSPRFRLTAVDPQRVRAAADRRAVDRCGTCSAAYVGLTKPRIIELLLLTTVPVMFLAAARRPAAGAGGRHGARRHARRPAAPTRSTASTTATSTSRCAGPGAAPLPRHMVSTRAALVFGLALGVVSTLWLGLLVNWLSAGLALAANVFYVVGYTMILKRRTTQNIVWGGAAGCFPALIGWTAVTGELAWAPVVLFLVVFFWTPPHFWALAIRYREDYAARRRADAAGGQGRRHDGRPADRRATPT